MPAPVSKRQARLMHAIIAGKVDPSKAPSRGVPPKSVAGKYAGHSTKDLPEQSGENRGGNWNEGHHAKAKERVKEKRKERKEQKKKKKKDLKKSFEEFYKGKGAGVIVVDKIGNILVGKQTDGRWATPGGHVEPTESYEEAALRELREEAGLVGSNPVKLDAPKKFEGNDSNTFLVTDYKGRVKPNDEFKSLKFMDVADIPFDNMRPCSLHGIKAYLNEKLKVRKSLKQMAALEVLEKNIIRSKGDAVLEVTHGDSLRLVGNGVFRFLRESVKGMSDEDFKEVPIGDRTLHIRKHMNDVYSGRVNDGHKMIHEFHNRSLPQLTAEIMSVFEWYLPEDEKELELLDDDALSDDVIAGGMSTLLDNYKRHNLADIYDEMNNIRQEIRDGNKVDLIEVEKRVMKLFDRLEATVRDIADKHNKLTSMAGDDIDKLEAKLAELQRKVDDLHSMPSTVEAYSPAPVNPDKHLETDYCYLPRPSIEISPDGRIKISFGKEWSLMDRENLLRDMRAKVIKSNGRS